MLLFENVSLRYGKNEILCGVNAKIEKGKLTVLVGKNGSGKSTLLSALIGQVPFAGSILLENRPLSDASPRERAKRIALMPQILPDTAFTVEQLAYMGRSPYLSLGAKYTQEDRTAVENALSLTRMQVHRSCPVNRLSGGERRLAFLALILAQNADLLVFDEPTAHLDVLHTQDFLHCVKSLVDDSGKTVLMVLHDLTTAISVADRLICLDNKQCVFDGTKEEFLQQNIARNVFGLHCTEVTDENNILRTVFWS